MKKKLLIVGSSHSFFHVVTIVTPLLSCKFDITLCLTRDHLTKDKNNLLERMSSDSLISNVFIINTENRFEQFYHLMSIRRVLEDVRFDICLLGSNFLPYERYIDEIILHKDCVKIIYFDQITYALCDSIEYITSYGEGNKILNDNICGRNIALEKKINKKKQVLKSVEISGCISTLLKLKTYTFARFNRAIFNFYERIILPFVFSGKVFRYRKWEKETQLTTGNVDLLLFSDMLEARIHRALYLNDKMKVSVIDHVFVGQCSCTKCNNNIKTILSPLSGVVGVDTIPEKVLEDYLSGFTIALTESGAIDIELRTHSRETGRWPYQLCDYLNDNHVPAKVVDSNKPISDIVCGYMGVVGFASGALRDARASCDYAFVVCFEKLSKYRYLNPKIVYGDGEGIGWINQDGTYNKDIFIRRKYHRPHRSSLVDKINEYSN